MENMAEPSLDVKKKAFRLSRDSNASFVIWFHVILGIDVPSTARRCRRGSDEFPGTSADAER
jgi:hypothetical protein